MGTQQLAKSIDNALETENAFCDLPPNSPDNRIYTQGNNQRGLVIADKGEDGLTPQIKRLQQLPQDEAHRISHFCNIRGDESEGDRPSTMLAHSLTATSLEQSLKHCGPQ